MEGAAHLFWSTESRAGFVHVKARGHLTIDAWARASALEPLKKGEMMDQFLPPTTAVAGAQLALDKPPKVVQAAREIPLRAHRDDKEKPIGAIEVGAEVYVMETLLGWVNVLPKNLGLTPADDGGFWIPSGEGAEVEPSSFGVWGQSPHRKASLGRSGRNRRADVDPERAGAAGQAALTRLVSGPSPVPWPSFHRCRRAVLRRCPGCCSRRLLR